MITTGMVIQVAAALVGSLGFAIFFKMKGRQIVLAGIGGALTWIVYLLCQSYTGGQFVPTFIAALFVAFYAEIMARVNKAPTTIFLMASGIPLIPGGNLYYAMAGLVAGDKAAFSANGNAALSIALAIALGFVTVAIIMKYIAGISSQRK